MKPLFIIFAIGMSCLLSACAFRTGGNEGEKRIEAQRYNNLGDAHFDQDELDEAIAAYKEAVRIKPNFAEAYNNLGAAYLEGGNPGEAIVAFKKATDIDPNFARAHNCLGLAYLAQGKLDEAIAAFKKAASINPRFVDAYYNLADVYSIKSESSLSLESLETAMMLEGSYLIAPVMKPINPVRIEFTGSLKLTNSLEFVQSPIE